MYWRDRTIAHGEPKKRAMPKIVRDDDDGVWSIVCFVVDKPARRRGIASALLEAGAHGASSVEAYPHVSDSRAYMGNLALYEGAGFTKLRDASKRVVVRSSNFSRLSAQ